MKKLSRLMMAIIFIAFWGCSSSHDFEEDKPLVKTAEEELTLKSLSVTYDGTGPNLISFDSTWDYYSITVDKAKFEANSKLVLTYEIPENAEAEVTPNTLILYDGDKQSGGWRPINRNYLVGENGNYPVPRPDPDFEMEPSEGVGDYVISISLSVTDTAPTEVNGILYTYLPKTYNIYIAEPVPPAMDINDPDVRKKIDEKINEAQKKIQSLGILVGNPADNDPSAKSVETLLRELNALVAGETKTREVKSLYKPGEGVDYVEVPQGNETYYMITESYQLYEPEKILLKTKQLSAALEVCTAEYIIVESLSIAYVPNSADGNVVVQDVMLGSDGEYSIELAGGGGGHVWTNLKSAQYGGRGGHVKARFDFEKGVKLGIRIGGEGVGTATLEIANDTVLSAAEKESKLQKEVWGTSGGQDKAKWIAQKPGGTNGGGIGGKSGKTDYNWAPGAGGGGFSDVRIYDANGNLNENYTYNDNDPRIMVAGGGGGAGAISGSTSTKVAAGGNAGQSGIAGKIIFFTDTSYNPLPGAAPAEKGIDGMDGKDNYIENGQQIAYTGEGRGGGGGGFRGGEAIDTRLYKDSVESVTGSGAGGSNHVSPMAKGERITGIQNQWGNGFAIVTWLGGK